MKVSYSLCLFLFFVFSVAGCNENELSQGKSQEAVAALEKGNTAPAIDFFVNGAELDKKLIDGFKKQKEEILRSGTSDKDFNEMILLLCRDAAENYHHAYVIETVANRDFKAGEEFLQKETAVLSECP